MRAAFKKTSRESETENNEEGCNELLKIRANKREREIVTNDECVK